MPDYHPGCDCIDCRRARAGVPMPTLGEYNDPDTTIFEDEFFEEEEEYQEYCDDEIHPYDFTPRWQYHRLRRTGKEKYLGIELEVETTDGETRRRGLSEVIYKVGSDFCFGKHDSSIDCGVEFVYHPCTWGFIQKNKDQLFNPLIALKNQGWSSYASGKCGLHVHYSRSRLSDFQMAKMLKIWKNGETPLLSLISGRNIDDPTKRGYSFCPAKTPRGGIPKYVKDKEYDRDSLNLCPRKTIEFRVFRGTLNKQTLLGRIGLVPATEEFINKTSYRNCSLKNLGKWALEEMPRKRYPETFKMLNSERIKKEIYRPQAVWIKDLYKDLYTTPG